MPLFTLPLSNANGQVSRAHTSSRPSQTTNIGRKRKRAASPPPSAVDSQPSQRSSPAPSQVSTHISNPLSLNDASRAQYLLAGLPLDAELPSTTYTNFPAKALPDDAIIEDGGWSTAGEQTDLEVKKLRQTKGSHLKLRHLGVLTAIVQRCLLEGDIKRATKAWSLLIRAQIGGKGLDLRSTSYWGIGAELLIRSGQTRPQGRRSLSSNMDEDGDSDRERDDDDALRKRQQAGPPSWGSKEGIAAAKAYYERLILQHPYLRQFAESTLSSLDFWPAMLSCEVYGVQQEYDMSMAQVATTEDVESSETGDMEDDEDSLADESIDQSDPSACQTRLEELELRRLERMDARREEKEKEREWTRKDAIRHRALEAATAIATRMDELMTGPPWTDSSTLLRLRGCMALWVGDLSVPNSWAGKDDNEDEDSRLDRISRSESGRNTVRARKDEDRRRAQELGRQRRKNYRADARNWFAKAERRGARCPDVDLDEEVDEDETERTF